MFFCTQAVGDVDNNISDKLDIDEIFVATAYADGGSYIMTASTTDNRTIYIYIDKSGKRNDTFESEIAFINAENLGNSAGTMNLILIAMDARFRSHFSGKSPTELLEKILSDQVSEYDRKIFSLVFLLEEVCAKQVFKKNQIEIVKSIDCDFYLNEVER